MKGSLLKMSAFRFFDAQLQATLNLISNLLAPVIIMDRLDQLEARMPKTSSSEFSCSVDSDVHCCKSPQRKKSN